MRVGERYISARIKKIARATILFTTLLVIGSNAYSQDPKPSPTPATREAVANNPKGATENAPQAAAASPASSPEPDFWHQEEMTGDWGGARGRLKEKGVELEFKLTQFYQGVAAGGIRHDSEYNGKFQTVANSISENLPVGNGGRLRSELRRALAGRRWAVRGRLTSSTQPRSFPLRTAMSSLSPQ